MARNICPIQICFLSCMLFSTKYGSDVTVIFSPWSFPDKSLGFPVGSNIWANLAVSLFQACPVSRFTCLGWPTGGIGNTVPDFRAIRCARLEFILSQCLTRADAAKELLVMYSSSFPAWLQHVIESPNSHLAALLVLSNLQVSLHWFTQGLKKKSCIKHLSDTYCT